MLVILHFSLPLHQTHSFFYFWPQRLTPGDHTTWPLLLPGFQKVWASKRLSKSPETRSERGQDTFAVPSPVLSFHFLEVAILPHDYNVCLVRPLRPQLSWVLVTPPAALRPVGYNSFSLVLVIVPVSLTLPTPL